MAKFIVEMRLTEIHEYTIEAANIEALSRRFMMKTRSQTLLLLRAGKLRAGTRRCPTKITMMAEGIC